MEKTLESNVYQLLTDVADVKKRFEAKWRETGEKYNLFMVAEIAHKEVIMCRVLADLLSPQGKHCQGSRYLRLFWETISPKLPRQLELSIKNTKVTAEYVIDENRRIDITLEDGKIFVPIEVKIWAGDQPKQVADYHEFAKKKNKNNVNVPVLYLTVDGHEPSDFSKAGVGKDDYVSLSFKDDILTWLEACALENTPETTVPVRENLRQLIAAIKSLCGKSEDAEMENEIFKLVTKDDDSARAALDICRAADFNKKVLETFGGSVLELVQKVLPAECLAEDGWNFINIPIKDGRYCFEINYLWDKACVQADNGVDAASAEGNALYEKMNTLFDIRPSPKSGFAWYSEEIVWPGFARDDLYQFRMCKLYTDRPQEAAQRIISIIRELEK